MVTRYDVPLDALIRKTAEKLKQYPQMKPPVWAAFVKTGMHKERPPTQPDWWYLRAAGVLQSVDRLGPVGVSKLRTKYGGRKNRGHKVDRGYKGSGSIIRKALQQLETLQLIAKVAKGVHKGRVVSRKGIAFLDNAAFEVAKILGIERPKPLPPEPKDEKKEQKKEEAKSKEGARPKGTAKPKEARPKKEKKAEPLRDSPPLLQPATPPPVVPETPPPAALPHGQTQA